MRKLLFALFTASAFSASAQVIDFENLTLPKADTFYVNYSNPGQDVGFNVGDVHFQCYYDTAWGGLWSNGFAYSNMTDSTTIGYTNQYSAKTAKGYNNSNNYVVYWDGYGTKAKITNGDTAKMISGFYITNSTYVYTTLRDGYFNARKFGDTTGTGSPLPQGNYPDWMKLTIKGYNNGALLPDTVDFYLADYRFNDDDSDYIVGDWQWLDLTAMGSLIDSVEFHITSSDTGSQGMNTPAYFCMDDFTRTTISGLQSITDFAAKVYPNPATTELNIVINNDVVKNIFVTDLTGRRLAAYEVKDKHVTLPIAQLPSGIYLLHISNGRQTAAQRFIKQ